MEKINKKHIGKYSESGAAKENMTGGHTLGPENIDAALNQPKFSPFQRFKEASDAILEQGRHTDEEDTNQLNKKEKEND